MKKLFGLLLSFFILLQTSISYAQAATQAVNDISNIALNSSCSRYEWKTQGRAPAAYTTGLAVTFAKSLCRLHEGQSSAILTAEKNNHDSSKDALSWYQDEYDELKLDNETAGPEVLRNLYTLAMGMGMLESSGKYCEGYDVNNNHLNADSAETGTFQSSYDSIGVSPELGKLYDLYRRDPSKCYQEIYSKNVSCHTQSIIGTGPGADFQRFVKSCPAFGAEFAMITLRVDRLQYGTLFRHKTELNASCNDMFAEVQNYVETSANEICPGL